MAHVEIPDVLRLCCISPGGELNFLLHVPSWFLPELFRQGQSVFEIRNRAMISDFITPFQP